MGSRARFPIAGIGAEAGGGEAVAADHVYICPPDRTLTIARGKLRLQDRPPTGLHRDADEVQRLGLRPDPPYALRSSGA